MIFNLKLNFLWCKNVQNAISFGQLLNTGIFMFSHLSSMLLAMVLVEDWGSEGQSQCLPQRYWSPFSMCSLRKLL